MKILLVVGFATTPRMWKKVIKPLEDITCISYRDYSNYGYENYDLYIFHSIACKLNIKEDRLARSIFLHPAFEVLFPYKLFIVNNDLCKIPLNKIKPALMQVNSNTTSVVSNKILMSSIIIRTEAKYFDFAFNPKRMRKTLYSIIFKFKESNND